MEDALNLHDGTLLSQLPTIASTCFGTSPPNGVYNQNRLLGSMVCVAAPAAHEAKAKVSEEKT